MGGQGSLVLAVRVGRSFRRFRAVRFDAEIWNFGMFRASADTRLCQPEAAVAKAILFARPVWSVAGIAGCLQTCTTTRLRL
jgi:hypothetical protein